MLFIRQVVVGTLVFVSYLLPLNSVSGLLDKPTNFTGDGEESTDANSRKLPVHIDKLPRQSPVDIIRGKAVNVDLPPLKIIRPSWKKVKAKFYNSGFSVYVKLDEPPSKGPRLEKGPLESPYFFVNMHIHWGRENLLGSEHFMDGESCSMEIHLVHFNSKYGTFQRAAQHDDGRALLTIFVELSQDDNALLDPLYRSLSNITKYNSTVILDSHEALQWAYSAVENNTEYYTYQGSLTTPPYTENLLWLLLPKPIHLSAKQLEAFRRVRNEKGAHIIENKREIQPLFGRQVVVAPLEK